MKKELRVLETFAGIGAPRKALIRGGYNYKIVDSIEIDPNPIKSYNAIYNDNLIPQDISQWNKTKAEIGEIDLIWNSSPCQDFSLAGKQQGGDEGSGTRSSLVYEVIRIVKEFSPKYIVWENVKGLTTKKHKHILDDYIQKLEELGYHSQWQVLNAKDYGIPQNRERVFVVSIRKDIEANFKFPEKQELNIKLKDLLEKDVSQEYYLTPSKIKSISNWKAYQKPFEKVLGNNSIVPTLTARGAGEEHSGMLTYSENLDDTTNLQPTIIASRGRYNENGEIEQHFEINKSGNTNTITTVQKDNYLCENLQDKQIGLYDYTSSDNFAKGKRDYGYQEVFSTLKTNGAKHGIYNDNDLRIRKLTEKECWRLMGFNDDDFEKAAIAQNYNKAKLYKQARK